MSKLHIPGMGDVEMREPSPDTQLIVQSICTRLDGLGRQLDLLIKLECGVAKRADIKRRIEGYEAAEALRLAGQEADAAAEAAPSE